MRYIPESRLLFLHILKTGGCAVEKAIDKNWGSKKVRHRWNGIPGRHARRVDLCNFRWEPEAFAFCFVRHPLAWYVSCWRHLIQMEQNRIFRGSNLADMFRWYNWHPQKWLGEILSPDYNIWVQRIVSQKPGYLSKMYEEYIGLDEAVPHVQFVGRQETLSRDIEQLSIAQWTRRFNATRGPKPSVSQDSVKGIMETEGQTLSRYYGHKTSGFRLIEDWA